MRYVFMRDYGKYKAGDVIEIATPEEAQRLYLATGGYLQAAPDMTRMQDAPPQDRMQRRKKAR